MASKKEVNAVSAICRKLVQTLLKRLVLSTAVLPAALELAANFLPPRVDELLGRHAVGVLQQSLELVVLGEGDDPEQSPELTEDLESETGEGGVRRG